MKAIAPNTSSSYLSWKPAFRGWKYLWHGTACLPVFCTPSHLLASDSSPQHLTKPSQGGFNACTPWCYSSLFPSYFLTLFFSLSLSVSLSFLSPSFNSHHKQYPSSLPQQAAPPPALSFTPGTDEDSGCERGSCSQPVTPPDSGLDYIPSWHKPICRCPPWKSITILFLQSLYPFVPPHLSPTESMHS